MAVLAFVSQKGGCGKSTISQAFATEATRSGLKTKLIDLDAQQTSTLEWHRVRLAQSVEPAVEVQGVASLAAALRDAAAYDYLVIDAPGKSSVNTLAVARAADLVLQPTGASLADLRPAVKLFRDLASSGVPQDRLAMVLCRIGSGPKERDARAFLEQAGLRVVAGCLLERPGYRTAMNKGRSVAEVSSLSLRTRAEQLVEQIGGLLS